MNLDKFQLGGAGMGPSQDIGQFPAKNTKQVRKAKTEE
jgi:hypothetical protein